MNVMHSPKKGTPPYPTSEGKQADTELDFELVNEVKNDDLINGSHNDSHDLPVTTSEPVADSPEFQEKMTTLLEGYQAKDRRTRKNSQPDPVLGAIELLSKELSGLRKDVSKATEKFAPVVTRVDKLEQHNSETDTRVAALEERVQSLEISPPDRVENNRVDELDLRLDEVQQATLHTKLTLSTTAIQTNPQMSRKDVTTAVQNFIIMKLAIPSADLIGLSATRVKPSGDGSAGTVPKPKFILECGSLSLRNQIRERARENRPADCYINEYLTPRRHKLMFDLRKLMATEKRIKRCFSDFGRIFIVVEGRDSPYRVNTMTDVQECLSPQG